MSDKHGIQIVYDGDCPFCSSYVALVRLREAVGDVELIDARSGHPLGTSLHEGGYDLNEGMAAVYDGKIYHGSDCVRLLAELSADSGLANRSIAAVFRSDRRTRLLYPVMRAGRNTMLRILGRDKI